MIAFRLGASSRNYKTLILNSQLKMKFPCYHHWKYISCAIFMVFFCCAPGDSLSTSKVHLRRQHAAVNSHGTLPTYTTTLLTFHQRPQTARMQKPLHLSLDEFSLAIYDAQLWASVQIEDQLASPNPISFIALYASGLLTSFSPCVLSFLPLTIAYLGFNEDSGSNNQDQNRLSKALAYAFGLSVVLCSFGVFAALAGKAINPLSGFSVVVNSFTSLLAIIMGFNLLNLVDLQFPSLEKYLSGLSIDRGEGRRNTFLQPFLFGATTALVAEPCTSPVLASLIALVGASGNPISGGFFLFAYSMGYVTPVISAGLLSGSISSLVNASGETSWINDLFASLLIIFGTYKLLDGLF